MLLNLKQNLEAQEISHNISAPLRGILNQCAVSWAMADGDTVDSAFKPGQSWHPGSDMILGPVVHPAYRNLCARCEGTMGCRTVLQARVTGRPLPVGAMMCPRCYGPTTAKDAEHVVYEEISGWFVTHPATQNLPCRDSPATPMGQTGDAETRGRVRAKGAARGEGSEIRSQSKPI